MTSQLNLALLRIAKRAEKQSEDTLEKTFVDYGAIVAALLSKDHHVIYGRRGTGKTHLISVLRKARHRDGMVALALDMRNLGSTGGIYNDPGISIQQRGTRLLIDVLAAIHEALLNAAFEGIEGVDIPAINDELDALLVAHKEVRVVGTTTVEMGSASDITGGSETTAGLAVSQSAVGLNLGAKEISGYKHAESGRSVHSGALQYKVNFGGVGSALGKLVKKLPKKRLFIFIDEWSEVPLDLQPMLADLLRRAVLPVPGVTVNIAAIEQRTRFLITDSAGARLGFELGADIPSAVTLDDYMVFDNDQAKAVEFFKTLVFKHVVAEFEESGLPVHRTKDVMVSAGFTQTAAFDEVVRACEGVPRDALSILGQAARMANDGSIAVGDVRRAAQSWYQGTKDTAVASQPDAKRLLVWLTDKVIKERRAKAFLLEAGARDDLIDFLYDERVLHVLRKGISAKDMPGHRYTVYGIDYGCYVDLISTAKAPQGMLDIGGHGSEFTSDIPQTDLRSVRRCILSLPEFYQAGASAGGALAPAAPAANDTNLLL